MTKQQLYILIPIVTILVLILTNPSEENHIQNVKSKCKIALNKKAATSGGGISSLLKDSYMDKIIDRIVSRDNYFLCSATKLSMQGQEKIIGFGILGNVFLSEKLNEGLNKDKKEPEKEAVKEPEKEVEAEEVETTPSEESKQVDSKSTWYSKNFYGNGVTEYLEGIFPAKEGSNVEFYYYSSTNPKKIQLQVHSKKDFKSGMEGGTTYKVSFPNQKGTYSLTFLLASLTCENPNGKTQEFTPQY